MSSLHSMCLFSTLRDKVGDIFKLETKFGHSVDFRTCFCREVRTDI